jgi:hypothetical protein
MKRSLIILLFLAIFISPGNSSAQTFRFGTVAANAGLGFGIYGITAYSPINKETHSGIGFVGTLPCVNAEIGLLRILGVGVHYRRGTYGKTSGGSIRGSDIAVMVNLHLANKKEKFDLVIGGGYGFSGMNANLSSSESLVAKGSMIRFQVAPHFYFGKNHHLGMFLRLAYNKHLLNHNIEIIDSTGKTYTEADGATWNMGGIEFNLGLAFKLDLKKKDE